MRAAVRAVLLVTTGALLGAGLVRATDERHFLRMDGRDWEEMGPKERRSWVQGFLAGHGFGMAQATGAKDSLRLVTVVDSLRRYGHLTFPYAPNVYDIRLADYYRWENHRPLPLWYGMWETGTDIDFNMKVGR